MFRRASISDTAKTFAPGLATVGLSVLGVSEAEKWEKAVFALCIAGGVVWLVLGYLKSLRFIEPRTVRKRCHRVMKRLAERLFKGDDSLTVTLFVPDRLDGDPYFIPIVRYIASRPDGYDPESLSRFRCDGSAILRAAFQKPGTIACADVPGASFNGNRDDARAWYVTALKVPLKDAKRLSDRTLFLDGSIADVFMVAPFEPGKRVAFLSFTSGRRGCFRISDQQKILKLRRALESLAILVAPM